jgi:hypothetical protein
MYTMRRPPVSDSAVRWGKPPSAPMWACVPLLVGCLLAIALPLASNRREVLAVVGAVVTLAPLSTSFRCVVMDGSRLLKREFLWRSFDLDTLASVRGHMTRNGPLLKVTDSRGASFFVGASTMEKKELAAFCSLLRPYLTRDGVEQKDDVLGVLRYFGG